MTIGYILLGLGILDTIWMIYSIRNYSPERAGILDRFVTALHKVGRTTPRPKTKIELFIERSSYWFGLLMGLVMVSLGVIFVFSE